MEQFQLAVSIKMNIKTRFDAIYPRDESQFIAYFLHVTTDRMDGSIRQRNLITSFAIADDGNGELSGAGNQIHASLFEMVDASAGAKAEWRERVGGRGEGGSDGGFVVFQAGK